MCGFIIERNFDESEHSLPGICAFFASLVEKPKTFLQLVWLFTCAKDDAARRTRDRGQEMLLRAAG